MAASTGVVGDFSLGNAYADLSARTYRAVKLTALGVEICGAGERAHGILQNKPKAGEACAIRGAMGATSKLVVDATTDIVIGELLKSDTEGRGVKGTASEEIFAIALAPATEPGHIIEVQYVNRG